MTQSHDAEQVSSSNMKSSESTNGSASPSQVQSKAKHNSPNNVGNKNEASRVSPGLKTLATSTLATNVAQQRALLTKKPEGIQISRSKHWKFISSYHGPYHFFLNCIDPSRWLQLPPELLTQLSYVNESSRPPLQISPTIFSSVLQIRTLVDEATHLAVRAHNPLSGPHGTGKISRERQFRMYELAVEKLARAYALDEVAASVASMQSASAVEEVAGKVLERARARGEEPSRDARYVYFFCEKIPSRYGSPLILLIKECFQNQLH
jgi:hypothetical protein